MSYNNHWEIVKSGNIVVSNTPETLMEQAFDYFKWCDEHPIVSKKTITSGKGAGNKVETESTRPYSVKALCLHCGISQEYLNDIRDSKDKSSMYSIVVERIMYIIYTQNLELASVNVLNPVFMSKLLGVEKEETVTSGIRVEIVPGLPELNTSESDILEKMRVEKELLKNPTEQFGYGKDEI